MLQALAAPLAWLQYQGEGRAGRKVSEAPSALWLGRSPLQQQMQLRTKSDGKGVWAWVHGMLTCHAVVVHHQERPAEAAQLQQVAGVGSQHKQRGCERVHQPPQQLQAISCIQLRRSACKGWPPPDGKDNGVLSTAAG